MQGVVPYYTRYRQDQAVKVVAFWIGAGGSMAAAGGQESSKRASQKADDKQDRAEHDPGLPQAQPAQGALEFARSELLLALTALGVLSGALGCFPDGLGGVLAGASEKGAVDKRCGHQRVADLDLLPGQRKDVHQQRLDLMRVSGGSHASAAARAC